MSTKFRNLKNDLDDLDRERSSSANESKFSGSNAKLSNYVLLFAFLATLTFYIGSRFSMPEVTVFNPFDQITQAINQPSETLLQQMGTWMEEMGYGELTDEELTNLRSEGVTATYTSQIRDVGYTDVTLDQLVVLQQADVSATYARMMKELGYELTVEELAETRRAGVTANFTSKMMDLGYTREELSKDVLLRLRGLGVTTGIAERLINENGERASIEELIRYRISNQ